MGGEGSGRRPSADSILRNLREQQFIASGEPYALSNQIVLPNLSGVQPEARITGSSIVETFLPTSLSGSLGNFYIPVVLSGSLPYVLLALSGSTSQPEKSILFVSGGLIYGQTNLLTLSGGRVGIGTASPDAKLNVIGNVNSPSFLWSTDGLEANYRWQSYLTGNDLNFLSRSTSETALFLQYTTGNVGIGTTSPGEKLSVVAGTNVGINLRDDTDAQNIGRLVPVGSGVVDRKTGALTLHTSGGVTSLYHTGYGETQYGNWNGGGASPSVSLSGALFVSGGALFYKGDQGTITLLGAR